MDDADYRARLEEMNRKTKEALARASASSTHLGSDSHKPGQRPPHIPHRLSGGGEHAAAARTALESAGNGTGTPPEAVDVNGTPELEEWSLSSWTSKPIRQSLVYDSLPALRSALATLETLPPIVTPVEIHRLRNSLKSVALGNAFLLQGGDCAELFSYCSASQIDAKVKLMLQMSLILISGMHKPVVRVARMAGQYAKPRSSPMETLEDGREVPSFRGDILNGFALEARTPDPGRLVQAYFHSAATMNHIRAQLASGIADLHNPLDWKLGHVKDKALREEYEGIVTRITDNLAFMKTIGADTTSQSLESVDLFTSHEGLVLEYEQSLTRRMRHPPNRVVNTAKAREEMAASKGDYGYYNTSAHFLWIGDRTRQLDGAHVEYFRGIENPIGIKVGPTMQGDELVRLLDIVDPYREVGKVTLITRYGEARVDSMLPGHIEAVRRSGHTVVWQCDPMHGNTITTPQKIKTRHFSSVLAEVASAIRIHKEMGSVLGGVHLELTGEAVTECIGGSEGLMEDDLSLNYTTYCDPRLNEKQALEMAFLLAGKTRQQRLA